MPPTDDTPTDDKQSNKSSLAKARFLASMDMNYEKWHDGLGYDLAALDEMDQSDRDSIVDLLSSNLEEPWRKFEALEHINSPKAIATINKALKHPSLEVRIAASRFAKDADKDRENVIVEALEHSELYGGLTQILDQIETFHTSAIVDAMLKGLLRRGDSGAVNFAGMLLFIFGKADSSFDWSKRPLFLKFGTGNFSERREAFVKLCGIIGKDPKPYLDELESIS